MIVDGNARSAPDEQAADVTEILDSGKVVAAEHSPLPDYDPGRHRDWVRASITYTFIGIFALTVIASLIVVIWFGKDYPDMKDLLQPLLPAETGLIGSAVGFYFGSETRRHRERD